MAAFPAPRSVAATWLATLAAFCGCGRIAFDALASDAAPDAPPRCDWFDGDGPQLGAITEIAILNSTTQESDPLLVTDDPLTMYFASNRDGSPDIFRTQRATTDDPWQGPQKLVELNTGGSGFENGLQLDANGHGYFTARGSLGTSNIFEVQRDTAGVLQIVREVTELDGGFNEFDPHPREGDLELWFTQSNGTQIATRIATRTSTVDPWGNVQTFVHDDPVGNDGSPSLTRDGRVIVWTARGVAGGSELDIYYALRVTPDDPWGPKQTLISSSTATEVEPSLRGDGCELFFGSSPAGDPNWDIYTVTID